MGEHDVHSGDDAKKRRQFTKALLDDLQALTRIVDAGAIESGVRRVGAEQEMFLVDRTMDPAPIAQKMLDRLQDPRFTTELGRFNLEANLDPQVFGGSFLSDLERELQDINTVARAAAKSVDGDVLLVGILPTLQKQHLGIDYMSPAARYHELNRTMVGLSGGVFRADIQGMDELKLQHDNVMLEACNTSFQLHWQVSAEEFAQAYNLAQLITAPLLATSVNSPVLLRRRLWHETRIALFEQSVDVRNEASAERGQSRRVGFGDSWIDEGVAELFQENVSDHRVVLSRDVGESSSGMLARGEMPPLTALCLHNGTVYRWNRPCYGVVNGVPHLRIENRVLPAGPTIIDQTVNAAFFFGLMAGMPAHVPDPRTRIPVDAVRGNFVGAARQGMYAGFHWLDGRDIAADELIKNELIPIAREGLLSGGTDSADVDRYLGLLEERVSTRRTGALWIIQSLDTLKEIEPPEARHRAVTAALMRRQKRGIPVHRWTLATPVKKEDWRAGFRRVEQVMSTKVFTVGPDDVIDLAASLMDWKHVRHVPVEEGGKLVGVLSSRALLRIIARGQTPETVAVRDIMVTDIVTIGPDASPLEAIALMRDKGLGALPVVDKGRLVGIVSERDFLGVAKKVLEQALK